MKKIKRNAVYHALRFFFWFFQAVPRRVAIWLGSWVGLALWSVSARDQHKAVRHLSLVYGDQLTARRKFMIGRAFFINSGRNVADVLRVGTHFETEIKPLIKAEGQEYLEAAHQRGRGVVCVTGHMGNFELAAAYVHSEGFPTAVIGRELYEPRLDKLLVANREAVGLTNISTTDSPKHLLRWLKEGGVLGVLIDTDSSRVRGQFVPAFGRWSYTPVGQTILALRTGAAIVPAACLRTEADQYRMVFLPEIPTVAGKYTERDVYDVTCRSTEALTGIIDQHREQWPWQHNRWRTKRPVELDK